MELRKINGNTFYIPGATNIGVFIFKDKYTLLIDSGNNNQQARKISETLINNNLSPKYIINTHNHIDHSGGNIFFKENYPATVIYASEKEKIYIENDFIFPMYLYGGNPIRDLTKSFMKNKEVVIDFILEEGLNKINNEKFTITFLPGHAQGQIGLGTKDRVCFLADSLFSEEIIDKYSLPFLFDIESQFATIDKINSLDYDYFVLSHGVNIYNREELENLLVINKNNLNKYLEIVLELLNQPKTREDLLEEITILEELALDMQEYYFSLSTIAAFISYLYDKNLIKYALENGKLYFYKD